MNLNRYNPSSFLPHFTPDFLPPTQNSWYPPIYNPILHQLSRFPLQQTDFAPSIITAQPSNPSIYDFQSYPTKRFKRTINTFTEREFIPSRQVSTAAPTVNYNKNIIQGSQNISVVNENRSTFPSTGPHLEKEKKSMTCSPKDESSTMGSFEDLEMPPLKELYLEDLNVNSWLDAFRLSKNQKNLTQSETRKSNPQKQKQIISQIEKQKAQYSLQAEILRRLEKHHQELGNVIQQQVAHINNSPKSAQQKMNLPAADKINSNEKASTTSTLKVGRNEEVYPMDHEDQKGHNDVKQEEDQETLPCKKLQKPNKKKQSEKIIEEKPIQERTREASKRKNQKQEKCKKQKDDDGKESDGQELHEIHKGRLPKPVEVPQHLVDDNHVNFNRLMSLTITDDPCYLDDDESGFVTFDKDPEDQQIKVGTRYQARIPCFNHKNYRTGKRKPKIAWMPGMFNENDMKDYFEDLCGLMECEDNMIHEEKALKLLARKDWEWDKLRTNICKNEKFYSKLLISTASTYSNSKPEDTKL